MRRRKCRDGGPVSRTGSDRGSRRQVNYGGKVRRRVTGLSTGRELWRVDYRTPSEDHQPEGPRFERGAVRSKSKILS